MRVISGSARHLKLKTLDTMETRPTTDRIKETLFNMIAPWLSNCTFLDLFAGSGGIGIEALSRGAKHAVFVEQNRNAAACIKENLKCTKLEQDAYLMEQDAITALKKLEESRTFDYIFMDPPYNQGVEKEVLEYLSGSKLLAENGIIIIEASKETDFSYLEGLGYQLIKKKDYKTNKHVFIERKGEKEIC